MVYLSMDDYELIEFRKSIKPFKKYDAILRNKNTDDIKYMSFGDTRYENFRDMTGLDEYPDKIHNSTKRRILYRTRHQHNLREGYFSPSYFSFYYLW
jgi:hypothetical protein